MAYGKRRSCDRWRTASLTVGFLTIILVASAHAQSAQYIYWSGDGVDIKRANIDGSMSINLINSVSGAVITGFALDVPNNHIYWIEDLGVGILGFIRRANMDGTGDVITLRNDVTRGRGFALDLINRHMYWLEINCCIRRANLDGSGVTTIESRTNTGREIALDVPNNHIYWIEGGPATIWRNDLDGLNKNRIALRTDATGGQGIALDVPNNKMYWLEQAGGGKIRRANLDGSDPSLPPLVTGMQGIGIALDLNNEHIFWGDFTVPRHIGRANLDGSDARSWLTVTGYHAIVLQTGGLPSSGGLQVRSVPFRSQYVVLALFALLGCWYILRPH